MYQIDIEVDQLSDFIFLENKNNSLIELELGGIENNKDLFCFMLDLFCKGLVKVYGHDNQVEVDNLTIDDFLFIKKKMECAGIRVVLDVKPNDMLLPLGVNSSQIKSMPDNLKLDEYRFTVVSNINILCIYFELFHITV